MASSILTLKSRELPQDQARIP